MKELKIIKYTRIIPLYGNKHLFPYGKITFVNINNKVITCYYDEFKGLYGRKNYKITNEGSLYSPILRLYKL